MKKAILILLLGFSIIIPIGCSKEAMEVKKMTEPWPFDDAENVAVITNNKIMERESPILYVSHDEDDGMWQFLDGEDVTEVDAHILGLKEIIDIDPSLVQLADLPVGWVAWRESKDNQWTRAKR